ELYKWSKEFTLNLYAVQKGTQNSNADEIDLYRFEMIFSPIFSAYGGSNVYKVILGGIKYIVVNKFYHL
ncbi:MAG: hypothetical protein ABIO44_12930, partial [Saprospiraceae bacterium]